MSASQGSALTAVAFQLVATLETYDADVRRLVHTPSDIELYQRVSRHVDQMRMYVGSFPSLSVAWVEVLIRHFELTHGLWRAQQKPEDGGGQALQVHNLHEAVDRLRQLGHRLVAAS